MSVYIYIITMGVVIISVVTISMIITFNVRKKEFEKNVKVDISPQQMKDLEENINKFYVENDLINNHSIEDIAKVLKVEYGEDEEGLDSQACVREIDGAGKKIVVFRKGLSEEEKWFAFAHEIGHLINGDTIPATRPDGRNKAGIEQLADYTGAALLMPENEVCRYLQDHDYKNGTSKARIRIVKNLCKKYRVNEMMLLRRIKEIQLLNQ